MQSPILITVQCPLLPLSSPPLSFPPPPASPLLPSPCFPSPPLPPFHFSPASPPPCPLPSPSCLPSCPNFPTLPLPPQYPQQTFSFEYHLHFTGKQYLSHAAITVLTILTQLSTNVYSQVLVQTAEWTGDTSHEWTCPGFDTTVRQMKSVISCLRFATITAITLKTVTSLSSMEDSSDCRLIAN